MFLPMPDPEGLSFAFAVEVFFDGECPLCMREIRMLRRLDRKDRIRFTDIPRQTSTRHRLGSTRTG